MRVPQGPVVHAIHMQRIMIDTCAQVRVGHGGPEPGVTGQRVGSEYGGVFAGVRHGKAGSVEGSGKGWGQGTPSGLGLPLLMLLTPKPLPLELGRCPQCGPTWAAPPQESPRPLILISRDPRESPNPHLPTSTDLPSGSLPAPPQHGPVGGSEDSARDISPRGSRLGRAGRRGQCPGLGGREAGRAWEGGQPSGLTAAPRVLQLRLQGPGSSRWTPGPVGGRPSVPPSGRCRAAVLGGRTGREAGPRPQGGAGRAGGRRGRHRSGRGGGRAVEQQPPSRPLRPRGSA